MALFAITPTLFSPSMLYAISPIRRALQTQLQAKIDQKTKPLGSLGRLETLALNIGLIQNSLIPALNKPTILIFAGDHGIAEAGVSAYPQTVTAQMVANFLAGGAAISVFAKQHGLDLFIVDAGVKFPIDHPQPQPNETNSARPRFIAAKIAPGTNNFLHGNAMSTAQCEQAIAKGAELVRQQYDSGCNCIGFGEMGIGNTSSAALLMSRLTGLSLPECVGRGAGLDAAQLQQKCAVLQAAAKFHGEAKAPLEALAAFGGFEIAMMVGGYWQAAQCGMIIIVDGFIATAALLVASKLQPNVLDYCLFSHASSEQGHSALLAHLKAQPLIDLCMRLGEGSGIAVAFPLIQSAVLFLNEMASFADAGVDEKHQP